MDKRQKTQFLYNRAGFGISARKLDQLEPYPYDEIVDQLFVDSNGSTSLPKPDFKLMDPRMMARLSSEEREKLIRERRAQFIELNHAWLSNMTSQHEVLREKMTLFWSDHFACRILSVPLSYQLNDIIRKNALGEFGDLLRAVSKSPAMLQFLNGQQNRKGSPNENFAREVMELFTLGRGNYSENDIKEAARAFTGWGFNRNAEFVYRSFWHDEGMKTILGKSGNFDGDDVIDILLEQKQTAYFITKKIYKQFVNPSPDEALIKSLSNSFFKSDYNISLLLEDIFKSDWFYSDTNQNTIIKSPIELLAGFHIHFTLDPKSKKTIQLQQALGQVLFFPPGVDGWPTNQEWIDSSSMMIRMNVPEFFGSKEELKVKGKEQANDVFKDLEHVKSQQIKWERYIQNYRELDNDSEQIVDLLTADLLNGPLVGDNRIRIIEHLNSFEGKNEKIVRGSLVLASLPEYQIV